MKKNLSRALSLLLVLSLMLVLPAGAAFAEAPTLVNSTYSNLGGNVVQAGGNINFAAIAKNYTDASWHFYDASYTEQTPPASMGRSVYGGTWEDGALHTDLALTNVPASMDGWSVQAIFTNADGSTPSGFCTIHISQDIMTITQQPVSQTVAPGASVTLSVGVSSGSAVTYQWYANTLNNTSSGTPMIGANNNTLTVTPDPGSTTYYYCVISKTAEYGAGSVTSNTAAVTCAAAVISILQAPSSTTLNTGNSVTLYVSATCNNGNGVTYQWYSNTVNSNQGGSAISGATGTSYTSNT